jgi:hypothetical protein
MAPPCPPSFSLLRHISIHTHEILNFQASFTPGTIDFEHVRSSQHGYNTGYGGDSRYGQQHGSGAHKEDKEKPHGKDGTAIHSGKNIKISQEIQEKGKTLGPKSDHHDKPAEAKKALTKALNPICKHRSQHQNYYRNWRLRQRLRQRRQRHQDQQR